MEFSKNDKKGYLNLDAGFEKDSNIMNFVNKKYSGIPFENDNQYIYFEVFDTEKFLDTEIESNIDLIITKIIDKKAYASFIINDELIKIKFNGELDVIND